MSQQKYITYRANLAGGIRQVLKKMNNCSEIWPNICRTVFTLTPKTPGSTRGQCQSLCIISLMNYVTELITDSLMDYVTELISDSVMEKIRCSLRNSFCYHLQIKNQCMKFLLFQSLMARFAQIQNELYFRCRETSRTLFNILHELCIGSS